MYGGQLNKTPSGAQIEDAYFNLWMYTFSANVILVKILEIEAMEEETERYHGQDAWYKADDGKRL